MALPPLEPFTGDWAAYEEQIYAIYMADFVNGVTYWRGKRVTVSWNKPYKNKGKTFWHVTSEDDGQGDRIPDLERCKRIRWLKALIESPDEEVRTWAQSRDGQDRIGIAVPDFSYVLFLQPWPDRAHLLTAYCVERETRRQQYAREWEANKR